MKYEEILFDKKDGVAVITLNRPEKRNAINIKMRDGLVEALSDAGNDPQVRTVILNGGSKDFCVGGDINESITPASLWDKISPKRTYSYYHLIEDMGKPVIAAIAGYCLGGGLELACTCDIRIAAENALLGDAHSRVGLIGGGGSTQRLPRIIGPAKAKELIFSGEPISATEAARIGLVNRVVPTEQLMDEAKSLARLYAERPPIVIKLVKSAIDAGMQMGLAQALDYEAKCATIVTLTEDSMEGKAAFNEKRKPVFKGR